MTGVARLVAALGRVHESRNRGTALIVRHPANFLFEKDFSRQREHEAYPRPDLKIHRLRLAFRQMCVKRRVIGVNRDLEFVDVILPTDRAEPRQTCGRDDRRAL